MDRRQNNGSVKGGVPRHCAATSAPRNYCFNRRAGQSHKDNVRCTAVEEQPEAEEVQLLQPSSTSLLMISPGTLSVILVRTLSVCTLYYHAALESARVDPIRLTGFRPQTAVLSLRELYNTSRTYLARLEFPPL